MAKIYDKNGNESFLITKYPEFPSSIDIEGTTHYVNYLDSTKFGSVEIIKKNDNENYLYKIPYHIIYDNQKYNIRYKTTYTPTGSIAYNNFYPLNLSSFFTYVNKNHGWNEFFTQNQLNNNWNNFVMGEENSNRWEQGNASYYITSTPIYNNLDKTSILKDYVSPVTRLAYQNNISFSNNDYACSLKVHSPNNFRLGYKMIVSGTGLSNYFNSITNKPLYQQFMMVGIKGGGGTTEPYNVISSTKLKFYGLGNINTGDLKLTKKELRTDLWCFEDDNFCSFYTSDRTTELSNNYIAIAQPSLYFANSNWYASPSTAKGYIISAFNEVENKVAVYSGSTATYEPNKWALKDEWDTSYYTFNWNLSSNATYFVEQNDVQNIINNIPAYHYPDEPINRADAVKIPFVPLYWNGGPGYEIASAYTASESFASIKLLDLCYTVYPFN